jgi:hypothetical protein
MFDLKLPQPPLPSCSPTPHTHPCESRQPELVARVWLSCGGGTMPLADATVFPYGLRILVMDDDPTWLKILEKMLRKCPYEGFHSLLSSLLLEFHGYTER